MGQRLKELRTARGLTQKQMSEILGIDQSAYHRVEKGENALATRHCITLAGNFDISLDALLLGKKEEEPELVRLAREVEAQDPVLKYQVIAFIYEKKAERARIKRDLPS